jgi:hypothetical protein
MQIIRRRLNLVMHMCLALVVFSQFAIIAQACATLDAAPAAAFKQAEHRHCHDEGNRTNPNACLMHCLQGDQAPVSNEASPVVQFATAMPSETPVPAITSAWPSLSSQPLILAVDSGPPIPILYCRFLN